MEIEGGGGGRGGKGMEIEGGGGGGEGMEIEGGGGGRGGEGPKTASSAELLALGIASRNSAIDDDDDKDDDDENKDDGNVDGSDGEVKAVCVPGTDLNLTPEACPAEIGVVGNSNSLPDLDRCTALLIDAVVMKTSPLLFSLVPLD
jgi:hypothetical protein